LASSTPYSLVAVPQRGKPLTLLSTDSATDAARRYNAERRKFARAAQRERNPSFTIIQINRPASAETLSRSGYTMHVARTPTQQRALERRLRGA
jgi:hypothetical protein